jgi:hypothetical protein
MAQRTIDLQAEAQSEEATLTRDSTTRDVMSSDVMSSNVAAPSYRATDADITLTKNETPEDRMLPSSSWHVHLELHSDEFDKLQRVGLANHALAWREGMKSWQPVDDGAQLRRLKDTLPPSGLRTSGSGRTSGSQSQLHSGSFFDFVQRYSRHGQTDVKPVIETRAFQLPPPAPLPRAQRSTDLPPPGPLPTHGSSLARHVPYAIVQQNQRPLSSLPPAMALETIRQTVQAWPGFRRLTPVLTIVPVSAAVGALVASLVITFRVPSQPTASSMLPARPVAAVPIAVAYTPSESTGERAATVSASSLPTAGAQTPEAPRVSLDALPKVGSGGRSIVAASNLAVAPVAVKASSLPAPEITKPPERETRAQRRARVRRTMEERLAATAAVQQERAEEKAVPAEKAEPTPLPEPKPPGPPDRAAISRAVATAGNAAMGCGSGPESGRAAVTFAPSGNVQSVRLVEPFSDSSVNGCVLRALGRARVPAFTGDAVEVHKSLKW